MDSFDSSQGLNDKGLSKNTNSKRVQNRVHKSEFCAELQQIITASPELPGHIKAAIKAAIKALVKTHSLKNEQSGKKQQ